MHSVPDESIVAADHVILGRVVFANDAIDVQKSVTRHCRRKSENDDAFD